MGVRQFFDGLINALGGSAQLGLRGGKAYLPNKLTDYEIDACFRGSWLMRKIITKPATEMTREGRDWQTSPENIEMLEAEETRLDVWRKFQQAEVFRGLGGAGMILYVNGDDQATALDPARIKTGGLTAVHVWHRIAFSLGEPITLWGDPWFGHPSFYEIQLSNGGATQVQRFHPSRVVAFRGKPVAGIMSAFANDWWWGDSVVEVVKEAVDNVHTSEVGFATLIRRAAIRRLKVPRLLELVATPDGESKFAKRVQAVALGENSDGITWLDGGDGDGKGSEEMTDQQITWTGIPDIKSSYLATAAAAASIPATVLMEKSPDGMNASGDGDDRNWEKEVMSRQGLDLRPCINQIDTALVPSALGRVPAGTDTDPKAWWIFAPLSTPTEKEIADTFLVLTQAITALVDTGLIPTIALEKAVQNLLEERGYLPGLREALAKLKEDERFPSLSEPDPNDPSELNTDPQPGAKGGGQQSAGAGVQPPAARRRAANDARFTDATPRTMYVQRKLLNADELIRWAKSQGFESTLPADDMHVTVAFSRLPVDWMKTGADWSGDEKGNLLVKPGGPRTVERMGDGDAIALQFTDDSLTWRHQRFIEAGASWDWPEYQPHITISWTMPRDFDVSKVAPYVGPLKFGPELFSEVDEDWKQSITEE